MVAIRILSLQLLRRCADKIELAVADTAMAFAVMLLFLIHGFVVGAVIAIGAGLLHRYMAMRYFLGSSCRTRGHDHRSTCELNHVVDRGNQCRGNRTIRLPNQTPVPE